MKVGIDIKLEEETMSLQSYTDWQWPNAGFVGEEPFSHVVPRTNDGPTAAIMLPNI